MTTLIFAAIAIIKFDGGSPNDFASVLAKNLKQNVVVSLGDARMIEKAAIDISDLDSMSRDVRSQTKLVMEPGSEAIFSDQKLAIELIRDAMIVRRPRGETEQRYEVPTPPQPAGQLIDVSFVGLPGKAIIDGKVTFKTEKSEALQARMLYALGKPVEVHWIYERAPIFVCVKDMPVLDFAKWTARAIGARIASDEKEYRFDLDAQEIKKRAVATIRAETIPEPESGSPNEAEQARTFRVACISSLTSKQVSDALATPGASVRINMVANSALGRLAIQRIRQVEEVQRNYATEGRGPRNAIGLLQRVDNSRPAVMIVNSRFGVNMEIPVLDANGRPDGIVRL